MNDRPPHRNYGSWVAPMVRLIDGREVPSDSPEWRFQCEAQHILNLPNKMDRRKLLTKIEEKRGTEARLSLENKIIALWRAQSASAA